MFSRGALEDDTIDALASIADNRFAESSARRRSGSARERNVIGAIRIESLSNGVFDLATWRFLSCGQRCRCFSLRFTHATNS